LTSFYCPVCICIHLCEGLHHGSPQKTLEVSTCRSLQPHVSQHTFLCDTVGIGLSQENLFAELSIIGNSQTMIQPSLVDESQHLGAMIKEVFKLHMGWLDFKLSHLMTCSLMLVHLATALR
jgi:hypothetical protein